MTEEQMVERLDATEAALDRVLRLLGWEGDWSSQFDLDEAVAWVEDRASSSSLRLHALNRAVLDDPDVEPGPGLSTLEVRDDLGRTLEVAGMAYGHPVPEALWAVDWSRFTGERDDGDVLIVSRKPLDATKNYLVIAVEHPDEVEAHDGE